MKSIRVFLVDDNPTFLDVAAKLLSSWPEIELVGRALSGAAAIEQHATVRPDVVLTDLFMPGTSGLETTRQLKATAAPPHVVVMTLDDHVLYREAALAHGADGFVAKAALTTDLLPLLQALCD